MATRKVEVAIVGDSQSMVRAFRTADAAANSFDGKSNKLARTMRVLDRAVAVGAAAIGVAMVGALKNGFQGLIENEAASKQTAAAIKSTGGAANVTTGQIEALADSIEKKSGMDALAIQEGQNLLLTFTKIRNEAGKGNDIFDQTTKIMADVSTAMGTEPKVAAIQLGKALNDPIKGIGALSRVGIQFTAQQKEQIKTLVESGDVMGAQKIILKELETQFGGSANAAGETFAGRVKILKARFDEFTETLAAKLMPVLMAFMDWVERNWPAISAAFEGLFNALVDVGRVIGAVVIPPLKAMFEFMTDNREIAAAIIGVLAGVYAGLKLLMIARSVATAVQVLNIAMLANPFVLIAASVAAVAAGLVILWKKSKTFRDIVTGAWDAVKGVVSVFVDYFKGPVKAAFDVIVNVAKALGKLLTGDFSGAWEAMKGVVRGVLDWVKSTILALPATILTAAVAIGSAIVNGIKNGVATLGETVWEAIKGLPGNLLARVGAWLTGLAQIGGKVIEYIKAGVTGLAGAVWEKITNMPAALIRSVGAWLSGLAEIGGKVIDYIKSGVTGLASAVWSKISGLPSAVAGLVTKAFRTGLSDFGGNIIGWIKGGISAAVEGLKTAAKSALNAVVRALNTAKDKTINAGIGLLNKVIPGGDPIPRVPDIPTLATGGIVAGPMNAIIGEAGPEAVVPLSNPTGRRALADALREAGAGVAGRGGAVINLTFNGVLDAREAARVIQPELNRLITTTY